jgi:predicted RNA-binding Zn ribbon-like protein
LKPVIDSSKLVMPAAMTQPLTTPYRAEYVFDLDAGRTCLDFANTLGGRSGEHLHAYADLVAFATQSHVLTPDDAAWLQAEAERDPATAAGVLVRAKRLRSALRGIFSSIAADRQPSDSDMGLLNFDLAASLSHARVLPSSARDGYVWGWSGRNLDAPIWPITRSAADLLTSDEERQLVRECGADDCKWLFLDTTKNRSRQWCSMQSCGNREKARRHYQRVRARRDVTAVIEPIESASAAARRAPERGHRKSAGRSGGASARAG